MPNKVHNLDSFYAMSNTSIKLAEAYTGYRELAFLIKMCRLKPQPWLSGIRGKKTTLHRWWVDEHGNSLKIMRDKQIKIVLQDQGIKEKLISTDLYGCLPIDKVAKMSKLLYLLVGKDHQQKDHAIIAFLGIDDFLRVFTLIDEEWQSIAPLQLGLHILRIFSRSRNTKRNYKRLRTQQTVIWPCVQQESWFSLWGQKITLMPIIKQHQCIVDALKI